EQGGAVAACAATGPATAGGHRDYPDPRARAQRAATLMAKPLVRLQVVQIGLAVALLALVVRAGQVQLIEGHRYAAAAAAQRTERVQLDARRGALYDRHGTAIALTQETYHLGVAPNELRDPVRDVATIARQLRLAPSDVDRAMHRRYAWFAGPFTALEVQSLRAMRGIHLEPVLRRFYPSSDFARAVVGRVGDDGRGASSGGGGSAGGRLTAGRRQHAAECVYRDVRAGIAGQDLRRGGAHHLPAHPAGRARFR